MYKSPNAGSTLTSLNGQSLPLRSWVTNFHLLLVVIDPFSHESSWIINTASRVLSNFTGADCRVGWLVIGNAEEAATFLGPHSSLRSFASSAHAFTAVMTSNATNACEIIDFK